MVKDIMAGGRKTRKKKTVKLGNKGSFKIRPGALHRALNIPEGQKIGQKRMRAALKSSKPSVRKMAKSGLGLSKMAKG